MPAPPELHELAERFHKNYRQYSSQNYKEAELRKEFIDPLFEMLGWDVANKKGLAEQYKEVVHEPSQEVEGGTAAPDYAFRIGEATKFFVEVKKPAIDIGQNQLPAFQLRRYAWSKKLPLSILTNFEDIAVYDGRFKPNKWDKPTTARVMHITFMDLEEKWDELAGIFSPDAIKKGSFDQYAEEEGKKRGTSEVDDEFLKDTENWRETLAKNIALRNELTVEELNFSVQKLIDRIIFLRICEDRGTEPIDQLRNIVQRENSYRRLMDIFQQADAKYNSGLFHFQKDVSRTMPPDLLTPRLTVDDKILKAIIKSLYYPDSPYQFDVISADILGRVYEQFLGKVIRLTPGGHAKVEEKPAVKKAGGVYYTPTYIVDYIVENTIGRLCKGKSPNEMERLRILDPACGSGSFLIVAYSRLLKEHLDWYTAKDPTKWKDAVFQGSKGEWRLTLREKKSILLNNIYGVDIDSQAVEVTKLNLLLKALEGESKESVENVMKWFREPALPDLANNIKCGNSLVGFGIIDLLNVLPEEEREGELNRINPFTWEEEFPKIMKAGGFDAVIGNPPYVRQEMLGNLKEYFQKHYKVYHGVADLYSYFIEKGISLIKATGLWGMIVANKWMRANYGEPLRKWLKEKQTIEITDFGDLPVFTKATTYPCIMIVGGGASTGNFKVAVLKNLEPNRLSAVIKETQFTISVSTLDDSGWALVSGKESQLLEKLKKSGKPLGEYVGGRIYRGILTGLTEAFVIDEETKHRLIAEDIRSQELIKPFLIGKDIKRYSILDKGRHLILIPDGWTHEKAPQKTNPWEWFQKSYPAVAKHLAQFEDKAKERWDKGDYWWELRSCDYYTEFEKPKLLYLVFQVKPAFAFDDSGLLVNNAVWVIPDGEKYLLGILNSQLGWFLISNNCTQIQNGYQLIFKYFGKIPIRTINFSDSADKTRHDKMVALVERMLKLHKDLQEASTPDAKTRIQRQIDATDKEIDALVYELYGLTKAEIRIVEGG